ncbi:MAG: thioredoxin family protein [Kiritimatiellae bacterium]|nr:thioredoxin family protein [Kiritimatiellia bacterium]
MKKMLAMTCAALCALAASAKTSTPKGFTDDLDAALRRAAENGRRVVAVFSGSDWCGWCKVLDKKILSKEAFLKVATNTYELVYIDNPMDTKVLSETGRKNNRRITEKYGVKGFPTVLVLDAKGAEVATVSGYDGESGPEGYLKMLESEIRDAPDVKKYIKPIEDVLNRHDAQMEEDSKAARKKVREKFPEPAKDMDKKALRRYMREVMEYAKTVMFEEVYAKYIPLYEEAFAEAKAMKVPENMETRKKDLIEEQEERFEMLRDAVSKYEAEKNAPKKESADGEDEEDEDDDEEEEDVSAVRRGLDTWLKDWSENIRTNAAIETCASFRDKKLRPFLMAQMDPGGTATAEERKVMEKSIDYIWGDGGYRSFGDRKKLVEILDRTAKKPFAAMVRALSDNKGISGPMADWIIDGDFHGEDMRCVFWTLRKNGAFGDAGANVLEKVDKSSADEWLKLILRIHVERRAAWESRGSGYANTVTEEGWNGYSNHGEACKAAFERAMELHDYPEAAYLFATLGPFDDKVFVETTARMLDFDNFYGNFLWYNCYPRWCGSLAKMKAFAERCYETKRHDTMIPYMYAESMLRMARDSGEKQEDYFRRHDDELGKILEVCLPQIKNANAFGKVRQEAGVMATLAYSIRGDWEKAGETWNSFWHGTLPTETWSVVHELSHWWMIWDGISGRNGKEMQRLHAAFVAGDFAGFVKGAEELRAGGAQLDGTEKTYLDQMELAARVQTDLPAGKAITAGFPKDKMSWLTYGGHWSMNGECAYPGNNYRASCPIEWDIIIPGEFRLELELTPEPNRDKWRFDFCQKPADPMLVKRDYPYLMLRFSKDGASAVYGEWDEVKDGGSGTPVPFAYSGGSVRLAIVCRDGRTTAFVGDAEKPVIDSDEHAELLRAVKEGKFQFNGEGMRLTSMSVRRP